MKKCSNCGAENRNESRYCHNCGFKFENMKTALRSNNNIFDRFKNANRFTKIIMIIAAVYILFLIIGMIPHVFLGVPFSSYVEEAETKNLIDFNAIDMDSDGALSFDEADGYAPDIDYSHLSEFFDEADKNDNGLLKGGEFDWYLYKIDKYYKDLEKQKKAKEDAARENSKYSSSSIPTVKLGECPSCGSDASYMYDYYDEFGRPYYQCSVCDYWTYDEGEFYD